MSNLFKTLLALALISLPLLVNADGAHVRRICGIPPQQPTILPVTGEAMNLISDHRAKVTVWTMCAKQNAVYGGDYSLLRVVEHQNELWVLEGLQRVRDAGYPTSEYVESVTE